MQTGKNYTWWAALALACFLSTSIEAQEITAHDLEAIKQKLERQERELQQLRARVAEMPQPRPLPPVSPGQSPQTQRTFGHPVHYIQGEETPDDLVARVKALEEQLEEAAEEAEEEEAEALVKPIVKPRGRLHYDMGMFDQSDLNQATVGDIQNGVSVRRARLGFDAALFQVTQWRLDFEMTTGGGRPSIFDAYGRITDLPYLQNVQIGHFREPFSLEALTSSNWLTFIERSTNNVFDPSRNAGIMEFGWNQEQSMTWAVGVFRDGTDVFGDDIGDTGEIAGTGRVTWLPYYDEPSDGRYYLHLGVSGSYRDPEKINPGGVEIPNVSFGAGPEATIREDGVGGIPDFIETGLIADARDVQLAALEASLTWGSFNIQSEYIGAYVDRAGAANPWFHGTYIQMSYFLTGEHRVYDRELGFFDRQFVYEPFFRVWTDRGICTGWGAWEVAARWNYLDLSDAGIEGGYLDDTTLGVNWYLNPYFRFMFNYIYSDLHDPVAGRSNANIFLARMSVWF